MAERVRRRRFGKDHEPWHKRRRERLGTRGALGTSARRQSGWYWIASARDSRIGSALRPPGRRWRGHAQEMHWVRTSESRILALQCHFRTPLSRTSVERQFG